MAIQFNQVTNQVKKSSAEVNLLVMQRGGKVGCVRWENGGTGTIGRFVMNAVDRNVANYNQINVLDLLTRVLRKEIELRKGFSDNNPVKNARLRLTLSDTAAISVFGYKAAAKVGENPLDRLLADNMTEHSVGVIKAFVSVMDDIAGFGWDVFAQTYTDSEYWNVKVPDGVKVTDGESVTFDGNISDNGIEIDANLAFKATYKIELVDGEYKIRRPGTSVTGRRMKEAKSVLWDMLPKNETVADIVEL